MAGVLEHLRWPRSLGKRAEVRGGGVDLSFQELAAAKEILEEIFAVSTPEVEEMIRQRMAEQDWFTEPSIRQN
jgi:hypothetical protein